MRSMFAEEDARLLAAAAGVREAGRGADEGLALNVIAAEIGRTYDAVLKRASRLSAKRYRDRHRFDPGPVGARIRRRERAGAGAG